MPVIETSQQLNPGGGVYRHPQTGAEIVANSVAMADGFVAAGFEYVRDAKQGEKGVLKPAKTEEDNDNKLQAEAVQGDAKRVVAEREKEGKK